MDAGCVHSLRPLLRRVGDGERTIFGEGPPDACPRSGNSVGSNSARLDAGTAPGAEQQGGAATVTTTADLSASPRRVDGAIAAHQTPAVGYRKPRRFCPRRSGRPEGGERDGSCGQTRQHRQATAALARAVRYTPTSATNDTEQRRTSDDCRRPSRIPSRASCCCRHRSTRITALPCRLDAHATEHPAASRCGRVISTSALGTHDVGSPNRDASRSRRRPQRSTGRTRPLVPGPGWSPPPGPPPGRH